MPSLVIGAAAVLVSGWVHFYLYFRGGYRGIAPESFARAHDQPLVRRQRDRGAS